MKQTHREKKEKERVYEKKVLQYQCDKSKSNNWHVH